MRHALIGCDVLRELDGRERYAAVRKCGDAFRSRVHGCRGQLAGRGGIAQVVCAFAEETDAIAAHVEARPHPVVTIRRRRDARRFDRKPSQPCERIANDLALEIELPVVGDVAVQTPAARQVGM